MNLLSFFDDALVLHRFCHYFYQGCFNFLTCNQDWDHLVIDSFLSSWVVMIPFSKDSWHATTVHDIPSMQLILLLQYHAVFPLCCQVLGERVFSLNLTLVYILWIHGTRRLPSMTRVSLSLRLVILTFYPFFIKLQDAQLGVRLLWCLQAPSESLATHPYWWRGELCLYSLLWSQDGSLLYRYRVLFLRLSFLVLDLHTMLMFAFIAPFVLCEATRLESYLAAATNQSKAQHTTPAS